MKTVATKNAPAALGPYAQAQVSGGFVFTSGQIGIDPATGVIADGIYAQYFTEPFPARSCVEVARLPKDVLVECEVIAEA